MSLLTWGYYNHLSLKDVTPTEKLNHILNVLCNAPSGQENQWSKKVIHVQVKGDLPQVIKSAVDYTGIYEGEEKSKGPHMTVFEAYMEKLLASNFFSLLKLSDKAELDPRICHMTDPAYCVLGSWILVCSSHFDYHKGHLRNLSFLLRDWGLTIIPEESFFAKRSVSFLGHLFFENHVSPDPVFLNLIDELPYPEKLEDALLVTSAVQHFKHFVPDFTEVTQSLKEYKLRGTAKKPVKFRWSSDQQYTVSKVRKTLRHAEPLVNPDFNKPFAVEMVVKRDSGAANILQKWSDGTARLVERMSRLWNKNEGTDNKHDLEISLIYWVLQKPRLAKLLKQAKHSCTVYTRKAAVDWLMNTNHPKCSKYENVKNFLANQKNMIFLDRSLFPQDFPSAVSESNADADDTRGRSHSSRRDEAKSSVSKHSSSSRHKRKDSRERDRDHHRDDESSSKKSRREDSSRKSTDDSSLGSKFIEKEGKTSYFKSKPESSLKGLNGNQSLSRTKQIDDDIEYLGDSLSQGGAAALEAERAEKGLIVKDVIT